MALKRAVTAVTVSGLLLFLSACSGSSEAPLTFEVPTQIPDQEEAPDTSEDSGRTASINTCLDVVEVYTGLVVLPMTTDRSTDATPETEQDTSALSEAVGSLEAHRDRLPDPVLPAFDDAVDLLQGAGSTLQPQEAAQIQRALQPVQEWITDQCSAALPEG